MEWNGSLSTACRRQITQFLSFPRERVSYAFSCWTRKIANAMLFYSVVCVASFVSFGLGANIGKINGSWMRREGRRFGSRLGSPAAGLDVVPCPVWALHERHEVDVVHQQVARHRHDLREG